MKKLVIAIAVLIAFSSTAAAANSAPWISSMSVSDSSPKVGDTVTISATAEDDDRILYMSAVYNGENHTRYCDSYLSCSQEWSFTPQQAKDYEIKVWAQDDLLAYSNWETRTVSVSPEERTTSIKFTQFPSEPTYKGEPYTIKAKAEDSSGNLQGRYLRIQYRLYSSGSWGQWDTVRLMYCGSDDAKSCSATTSFTPESTKKHEFRTYIETSDGKMLNKQAKYITPEETVSISDKGPSGTVSSPVELFVKLDTSSPSSYNCYYDDDMFVNQDSGKRLGRSNNRFSKSVSFSSGSHDIWMACFRDGNRVDRVSTSFDVSTGAPNINNVGPSGDQENPVTVFVELDSSPSDSSFTCRYDDDSAVNRYSSKLDKQSSTRWKKSKDFPTGENTIWFQCFVDDDNDGVAEKDVTSTKSTTFTVTEEDVSITNKGPSGTVSSPVELFVRLDSSSPSNYRCYYDDDLSVNKDSGKRLDRSGSRFSKSVSFSSGSHDVWMACFKDGNRVDRVSTSFTVSADQEASISNYGPSGSVSSPVELYSRLDADDPWNYNCYYDDDLHVNKDSGKRLDRSGSRFSKSVSFSSGSHSIWMACFRDGSRVDRVSTTFDVTSDETCGISVQRIQLGDSIISSGESTDASVRVNNNGDAQQVRVRIKVGSNTVLDNTRTVYSGRTFSTSISPSDDAMVRAIVNTQGEPCGSQTFSSSEEIIVTEGGGDDGDDNDPHASFTWSPSNPNTGEQVTFTSTSTDPDSDITSYSWSFGDGSSSSGSTVTHTYSQAGTYAVELTVEDSNGNTDSRTRQVSIGEAKGACSVSVGELRLGRNIISAGESTQASLKVFNNGDPQEVIVTFREGTDRVSRQQVTLGSGQRTFTTQVSPQDTTLINTRVETVGDPCGSEEFIRSQELVVTGDQDATLKVHVDDASGSDLENARVTVDGSTKRTDSDGDTVFDLDPGTYGVTVTKPGYNTRTRTVTLDAGEVRTMNFVLSSTGDSTEEDNVEITRVRHAGTVCRGSTLEVRVTVENSADEKRLVTLTGDGLGSDIEADFELDAGESRVRTLMFTNVQGTGTRTFTVSAGESTETRSVEVQSCPVTGGVTGGAASIAMTLNPDRAIAGQPVKVKGFVDGAQGRSEVTIKVDGSQKARVSTQPDGYYETYIRVEQVGSHTVSASAGGVSNFRTLEVLPTANVNFVHPPREVFEGESFDLCTEVSSQITPKLLLLEDGEIIQTKNAKGNVCFNVTSDQGEHEYEVRALTYGKGSSARTTVNVLETGVETSSFPSQVAAVESGSGIVKVELYNTHRELKRYDLELEGLPSAWISQSEKQVVLDSGERKTVYFYLTPMEEGTYTPELSVSSDGSDIYREDVRVVSGGTTEEQDPGFLGKIARTISKWRLY